MSGRAAVREQAAPGCGRPARATRCRPGTHRPRAADRNALLDDLRHQFGLALLFISHDLGGIAQIAERVVVLGHGEVCEQGSVAQVLRHPTHAATRRLLAASRSLQGELARWRNEPATPMLEAHDGA